MMIFTYKCDSYYLLLKNWFGIDWQQLQEPLCHGNSLTNMVTCWQQALIFLLVYRRQGQVKVGEQVPGTGELTRSLHDACDTVGIAETFTSIGKALKLTVCSEPLWFSFPQWKRTSFSSYSWSLGRGPPVTTEIRHNHNSNLRIKIKWLNIIPWCHIIQIEVR